MSWYRLYFLGQHGDIRNVDEFSVDTDDQALMLSDSLHDAVSDIYTGYELWQDSRRIFRYADSGSPHPFIPHQTVTMKIQAELLKREEVLHESGGAVARSRRLLERFREVRELVGSPDKRVFSNKRRSALNRPL